MSNYTGINSSLDPIKIRSILKNISIIIFIACLATYIMASTIAINNILTHNILICLTIIINLWSVTSILSYNRKMIIDLTNPGGSVNRGLRCSIRAFYNNSFDLIFTPTVTIMVVIKVFEFHMSEVSLVIISPMIYVILSVTQISPLKFRREIFTKREHLNISNQLNNITIARVMTEGVDKRTKTYKIFNEQQLRAEESMRISSDFLQIATGRKVMLNSILRFLTPMIGTIGPIIIRMLI